MASQLDVSYSRKLSTQVDALREEVIFYVKEFFEQLKTGFTEYCQNISEGLLLSNDFSTIYSQVMEDQKLLENMAKDIGKFSNHFVLKENFERYVKKLERTHEKYVDFSKNQIVPEVTLAKDENLFKKLQNLLKQDIRFENNLGQYTASLRDDIVEGPFSGSAKLGEGSVNKITQDKRSEVSMPKRPDDSYDINFLHYFQESSKRVHIMNLENKVLVWDTMDLDIGFDVPLFSSTVAARRDCVILAGGIDTSRKNTISDVFVLNKPTRSLLKTGEMIEPRNNFGLTRLKDKLYAIGGCNDKSGKLSSCESSLILSNANRVGGQWNKIASLRYPCSNPCVVPFKDRHLIKFGGAFEHSFPRDFFVEVYFEELNQWFPVNIKSSQVDKPYLSNQNYICDSFASSGYQRGENELIIVGGLTTNQQRSHQAYCMDFSQTDLSLTNISRSLPVISVDCRTDPMLPSSMITENIVKYGDAWYGLKRMPLDESKPRVNNLREREMFLLQ